MLRTAIVRHQFPYLAPNPDPIFLFVALVLLNPSSPPPFFDCCSRAIQSNKDLETTLSSNNRADLLLAGAKFQEVHAKLGTKRAPLRSQFRL